MDLNRYVAELQQELLTAAEAGGEDAVELAQRLVAPLRSSTRLVLLDALAAAAADITSELAPGGVELRLRGRDPEFVVTPPDDGTESVAAPPAPLPAPVEAPVEGDDAGTARVTLRLPEPLKVRVEDAAGRDGLSVNAWLVRTLSGALGDRPPSTHPRPPSSGQRFTGWSRA